MAETQTATSSPNAAANGAVGKATKRAKRAPVKRAKREIPSVAALTTLLDGIKSTGKTLAKMTTRANRMRAQIAKAIGAAVPGMAAGPLRAVAIAPGVVGVTATRKPRAVGGMTVAAKLLMAVAKKPGSLSADIYKITSNGQNEKQGLSRLVAKGMIARDKAGKHTLTAAGKAAIA